MHSGGKRFKQRGLLQVHRLGHQPSILHWCDAIFGKGAAQPARIEAEIETSALAYRASPTRPEGIQRDMVANLEFRYARSQLDHFTSGLMTDYRRHACQRTVSAEFPKV